MNKICQDLTISVGKVSKNVIALYNVAVMMFKKVLLLLKHHNVRSRDNATIFFIILIYHHIVILQYTKGSGFKVY